MHFLFLKHRLGFLAWILLGITIIFAWGSWQDPPLSSYARPVEFVVLNAPLLQPGADSARLQAQVEALPGITACAIRPAKQLLAVAFNPDSISQEQLCQRLGLVAQKPSPPSSSARQCPVPASYLLAIEKVRFFFNLRRLYIRA